jgi:hypothetical protein
MVSGLVTSPIDQSRICFGEASPIRIASKSLMSICAKGYLLRRDLEELPGSLYVNSFGLLCVVTLFLLAETAKRFPTTV